MEIYILQDNHWLACGIANCGGVLFVVGIIGNAHKAGSEGIICMYVYGLWNSFIHLIESFRACEKNNLIEWGGRDYTTCVYCAYICSNKWLNKLAAGIPRGQESNINYHILSYIYIIEMLKGS